MRFARPQEPSTFANSVAGATAEVAADVAAGRRPVFKGREKWRLFKTDLAAATFGKCGYCETIVWGPDRWNGDVEHFRPKSRIDELAPDGRKRQTRVRFDGGYYWLAYQWDNYLLSCGTCNSDYKRCLFPLGEPATADPQPGDERQEKPLLLNPFGRKDPLNHLSFDALGVVGPKGRSAYGRATIEVCGLDRTSLEKRRRQVAEFVNIQVAALLAATSKGQVELALASLALMGSKDREHCGMVRSRFMDATGLPWTFVEEQSPRPDPEFAPPT